MNSDFWRGRRVFLTGHTGFKGGWLSHVLRRLDAEVHGYALDPDGEPSFFSQAGVATLLATDTRANLRDASHVATAMATAAPEVVLHLGAQSLVRESYRDPVGTFATNVLGTAHVLDAARSVPSIKSIVVVTSDKCYRDIALGRAMTEQDALGGDDPYSASKGAAEIVTHAFRASFGMNSASPGALARVASARAGNVIGGGDWAA
ncbi:MAG: GDP-mannose 4,6-dehydratase, partial [Rhodobacteraceae bacterium]|nr:GDP-mannose 4,6-dehydratase [Paracoccaceae bacterium]